MALVLICTMIFTVPAFAVTFDQAKKDLAAADSGMQAVKQAVDVAQKEVNDCQYRLEVAERDLQNLKDKKIRFVRPSDMSKKEAEGYIKGIEHDIKEAEKYLERCRKELKNAQSSNKDANKDLQAQWGEIDKAKKALESAVK